MFLVHVLLLSRYGVSTALFAFDASDPNANGVAIASAAILSAVSLMILIYGAVVFCEADSTLYCFSLFPSRTNP